MSKTLFQISAAAVVLLTGAAACLAQTGAAPVITAPAASTERVTGLQDPGTPVPPSGPVAARAALDAAKTRRLVRVVDENIDNMKAKGNFGAQLWLVQGRQFFEDWKKPEAPAIDPVDIVQRGQTIYTAVIFYGAAHDTGGLSNVTYNIIVHRPDGTIYDKRDSAIGWQNLAVTDEKQLQLGRDSLGITIGAQDPAGLYTVEVAVRDNVTRAELPLIQHFVVR